MSRALALAAALLALGGCKSADQASPPVLLTVTTTPQVRVWVERPGKERRDLGLSPLKRAAGASVGDTVILENLDAGLRYEETIGFGAPNTEKIIEKTFQ